MAIYKPNNFYPHLQEIDLTQENTFSCQVNTDGAMVSAARLTISSEDNILVYENLYQFVDINGNKDPIENKGFMELPMEPYKINKSNISFGLIDDALEPVYYKYAINDNGKKIYYDEYGENGKRIGFATREEATSAQVYDEDGITILYNQGVEDGMLNNYNRKVVIINNIDFITLHPEPELSYDVRKNYCPYNFYNVKLKDTYCFGLKFVNSSDENDVFLYPFKYLDYEKTDNGYNMKITYNTELLFDDMSKYDCYIVLLNDKDYTWDVKMYEHLFREDIDKGTLVTDGYITGSTKTVFWWDANKQTEDTILNRKEIKEDYYVEINATEDNSDIFKEQLKLGRVSSGLLSVNNLKETDKDDNEREELLKSTKEIDVLSTYDLGVDYRYYDIVPYDMYEYDENGQKILKENKKRTWFYTNEKSTSGIGNYNSYYYNDYILKTDWVMSHYNFFNSGIDQEIYKVGCLEVIKYTNSSNRYYTYWKDFVCDVSVIDKDGQREFKIDNITGMNNLLRFVKNNKINNGDTFVSSDYRHWKMYTIDNEIVDGGISNPDGISLSYLNQDFYNYPFVFNSAHTHVVGFQKSYLTEFQDRCKENPEAYNKITQVIDFYNNNYISITFDNIEYYVKVFTPRSYSNHFYKMFKWSTNAFQSWVVGVNERCLKYPSILDENGNLTIIHDADSYIYYPNTIQGQIHGEYDDGDNKWTRELITTEDDIAAFLREGDYATAIHVPSSLQYTDSKFFNYINTVYPIKTISQENETGTINSCDLYYKIIVKQLSSTTYSNALYQNIKDIVPGKTYRVSGILNISGGLIDSNKISNFVNTIYCVIEESTNVSIREVIYIKDILHNDYIYALEDGNYYSIYADIKIPETFISPRLKINIGVNDILSEDDNNRETNIYNLSVKEYNEPENKSSILLCDNSVDLTKYENNMFIHTSLNTATSDYQKINGENDYKIKKYIKFSNKIELEDKNIEDLLVELLGKKDTIVSYYLFYKQRELITWVTEHLGFEKNINKIEVENEFKINLKDESNIELYGGDNNNTYYSFFGVRDSDLNVDDIYVRFPGYEGLDFNNDYINDSLKYYDHIGTATSIYDNGHILDLPSTKGLNGWFYQRGTYYVGSETKEWDSDDYQPVYLYGKNVPYTVFENNGQNDYWGYCDYFDKKTPNSSNCFKQMKFVEPNYFSVAGFSVRVYSDDFNDIYKSYIIGRTYNGASTSANLTIVLNGNLTWSIKYVSMDNVSTTETVNSIRRIFIEPPGYVAAPCYFDSRMTQIVESTDFFPKSLFIPQSYCKLFKITNYDYETGEFVIAGGLEREILNTDRYEVWQRTVNESMTNEYNITEVAYQYTRLYPPSEDYDGVAYVGDTKILKDGIKIMNNTNSRVFIQPNVNFYSDEYNHPYLYLDNYGQRLEFPYNYMVYDDGFTIEDRTIEKLDGSQWLLSYNTTSDIDITPGLTYKLYMDTCKSTPSNWFYGRNIANITMRVGEYNYISDQLNKGHIKPIEFSDFKQTFNDITNKKIGNNCLIQCVDAYFMATYDQLSIPIKRYRYKLYDSSMNLINDSGYIYDNYISYGVRGLRNEEIYLLHFEMEDQLGYVYHYEEKIIVKYIEYNTDIIQLQLTNKDSQGCIVGDFVTLVEAKTDFVTDRDTYDEDGNIIKKGTLIKQGMVYAKLCTQDDFVNNLSCSILDDVFIYRRNKEKLLSFVCKINLSKDQIITGRDENDHRYGFIDYGVYNNEYYDYVVILKQKDLTTDSHLGNMEYTYSESRCKTSFNGWILVDIEKDDDSDSYYVSDQVWNFKYNLESQDLTQNTSVSKWDTLGKYANVYIGQKNYISSGLTCLLGDVGTYYTYNGNNFKENFGYFEQPFESVNYDDIHDIISNEVLTNNIDKYLSWKTFNNNGNPKLLKDYKGNMWIVQIMENPTVKNADNSQEQVYTISFNWVEIMDWRKYPILGKNISFDREEAANIEIMDILQPWDYSYNSEDMFYKLNKVQDDWAYNNVMSYSSPLMVSGRITLETNSMTGILNDSYLGDSVLESEKQFLSSMTDEELEAFYNNKGAFMSPFKTKQLNDIYDYSPNLTYLNFEQSLLYENNSIDFVCCGMKLLNGININLTDAIKTARYAFAGTSISTDEQYQIIINTNNYINTYGMLDDLQGDGTVTVRWGTLAEDPDLTTYAELYERYWNNDNIILDCKLNFNINDWISDPIIDENGSIDGISYTKKIILKSYEGTLTSVYIPKFYKDENGEIYLIELSEDFNI